MTDLKNKLDALADIYNVPDFILHDPVQFPRRFNKVEDIEISALLTSIITWGRRDSILKNAEKIHTLMQHTPYNYIMNKEWSTLKDSRHNLHRTFFEKDMYTICRNLYGFYSENSSLENIFVNKNITDGLHTLSELLDTRHIASPQGKGPCKRTNLMLRWLIRNDGIVDMGVWKKVSPSQLIIPLDVHVSRIGRSLWNDLPRTDSMRTALKITEHLADFCPEDPCKYDFALFGLGVDKKEVE